MSSGGKGGPGGSDNGGDDWAGSASRRVIVGLAKLGQALRSQAWQGAAERRLTPTQGQILVLLAGAQGRGLRLGELADRMGVRPATASEALSTLAKKGLIAKEAASDDGRALAIRLTPAGRRESARAKEWPEFLMEAVDALDATEQAVLLRGLMKMIRTLQVERQIPVATMCVTCKFFSPHAHATSETPHHCNFVNAPFGDGGLRLECADHVVAPEEMQAQLWNTFVRADRLTQGMAPQAMAPETMGSGTGGKA